jgi:invasion protein IalB
MTQPILTPLAGLLLALALPLAAAAQDAATPTPAPADDGTGFSTGVADEASGEIPEGGLYVVDTQGDWEIRCVKSLDGFDPCQIYQLLNDAAGNATAELTVVALAEGSKAVAGATVLTPLETLLTQMITVTVDGGTAKRYPFSWCDQYGCYSRIGFTKPELDQLKKGKQALAVIVPALAPTNKVEMTISLTGFTKAYETMRVRNAETAAAAEAAKAAETPPEAPGEAPAETPPAETPPAGGN